jgi:phosphoserine phosphatase RsbU/P
MKAYFKILIAEDSTSIQNSMKFMLLNNNEFNCDVFIANNGREACTMAYHERPDIILTDIEMPLMSGIEAIKKIRSNNQIKHIPIIVMSSTRQFQEAFTSGADDFLVKPFDKYELLLRIQLNLKLAAKGHEIKKQNELLKTQRQEATNQRDTIMKQKNELIDGLKYASLIQRAMWPSPEIFHSCLDSYFLYNQPKSIVSGDFCWVARKNGMTMIAVADCTGHGMSGALMTMAGAAFLNEIIHNYKTITADEILNNLRTQVIHLLNQKGDLGEVSNGMDIALCVYDETSHILQFSGAYNPLYFIHSGGSFEIFKGNRMPIGIFMDRDQPFQKIDIPVSKGDTIYLFSDGYPDQIGGPSDQKFRYIKFRELIATAAAMTSMDEQLGLIKKTMEEWMAGYEQIDDMMILGIRF